MDLTAALTLIAVMLVLAAVPSASVALVVTRAATHGVAGGAAVAAGIVVGDLVFVTLALVGMSFLAETLGGLFAVIKTVGGAYLVWLGVGLIRSAGRPAAAPRTVGATSLAAGFGAGLLLTLGDVKAILFYASLFPAFVNVAALTAADVALIIAVTVVTVGGVKLAYAFAANRLVRRLGGVRVGRAPRLLAGGLLTGTGAYLIAKS